MRWVYFGILVYVAVVLQAAAVPFISVNSIRPDLLVMIGVYYALSARTYDALLACWCIGLAVDLTSLSYQNAGNVGLHAFAMGLIALTIIGIRGFTFRDSPLTQLLCAFAAKFVLDFLVGLHMMYVTDNWELVGRLSTIGLYAAIYTAVLTPYAHWCLRQVRTLLGIGASHQLRVR